MIQWMASPGKTNGRANGNGVWAAVHQQEGKWRVVIARRRERWEVLESLTLKDFEVTSLPVLFGQHGVSHVVRVARGRETVARCLPVPGGDEAGLVAAVSLLAEAELPSALPSYRRAAGVLPNGDGAEMRTALLTGWMNGGASPKALTEVAETWTTPAAALALLRGESGRAAVYTEASEGLMCLLVPGPDKTIARVLVEEPSDEDAWAQILGAAVAEAAQMAGAPASFAQSLNAGRKTGAGRRLFLEAASLLALKSRVSGIREDQGWLDDFGVALGALLVAGSELATVRALAGLHAMAPEEERTIVEATSVWLAKPANAWGLVAAACALMLLGPLGLAAARKTILEKRADKVKGLSVGGEGIEKKAAMYEQFGTSRWPMTKLLADVAQATPVGVVVTNLQITNGQGLTMQGTAENSEQVNKLEANLNAARVFGNVSFGRVDTKSDSVTEFDVTARVVQPLAQVKTSEEQDFKTKPLAVRLYGEGASNTAPPAGDAHEEHGDRGDRGNRRRDRAERNADSGGTGGNSGGSAERDRKPSSSLATEPVPVPLTDADIQKMDFLTATKEFGRRKPYALIHKELDAATKQRLSDEVAKLREQMDKMRSKSDTGAAPAAPAGATPAAPAPASGTPAPAPAPAVPPPPAAGGKP
jgi:Tfp pilus assembly protein PilN